MEGVLCAVENQEIEPRTNGFQSPQRHALDTFIGVGFVFSLNHQFRIDGQQSTPEDSP